MRLQAENLEQAAQSNYTSRVTSRITSVAPSLVASALQSRNTSRTMSRVPSRASMVSTPPILQFIYHFFREINMIFPIQSKNRFDEIFYCFFFYIFQMSTPPSPVSGRRSTNGISRCLSSNNVIGSPQTTTRGSASVSRLKNKHYFSRNCLKIDLTEFFYCRRNSLPGAFLNPTEAIHDNIDDYESSPETLENLIRVTQQEKSVLQVHKFTKLFLLF